MEFSSNNLGILVGVLGFVVTAWTLLVTKKNNKVTSDNKERQLKAIADKEHTTQYKADLQKARNNLIQFNDSVAFYCRLEAVLMTEIKLLTKDYKKAKGDELWNNAVPPTFPLKPLTTSTSAKLLSTSLYYLEEDKVPHDYLPTPAKVVVAPVVAEVQAVTP
jgi:hypothetical protein